MLQQFLKSGLASTSTNIEQWAQAEKMLNTVSDFFYLHELRPLAVCIFLVGVIGFLTSYDFLSVLVNIEVMMLGANFYLITSALIFGDYYGQVYALCFLAITAAETAVGLGLLILLYRTNGRVTFTELATLKG
jgi:NADH-quinone oxidoreductase subunit K